MPHRNRSCVLEKPKQSRIISQTPASNPDVSSYFIIKLHFLQIADELCILGIHPMHFFPGRCSNFSTSGRLPCNSHHYQPAIPHDLCTRFFRPIRALPLSRLFLQVRRPTARCLILPHHTSLVPTSQRTDTSLCRDHAPKAIP
jgi:hypothetical protein